MADKHESITAGDEKPDSWHLETETEKQTQLSREQQIIADFPEQKSKKLLRKVDLRLLPPLIALYLLSYIDRANIGNANIEGMSEDLRLNGQQYNVVLSIFFVTYIVFEIPSNYILERFFQNRPSLWIAIITFLWGAMMTLHGIANNYATLLVVRLLMGVFEAGLFPGAIVILNKWYSKFELGTRFSLFYIGAALAGAFSGIMAYGFAKMDGIGGLEGWRWIFIMEGLITVVMGAAAPFILPDSPRAKTTKRWMDESEAEYILARLSVQDGGAEAQSEGAKISRKVVWSVITDWQIYLIVLIYWSNTVPNYGLKFMMPQIITNMGYTASTAQLLTIPPYIAGAISAYILGRFSDYFKRRAYFIAGPQIVLIISYAILTPLAPRISENIGPSFFAIILANVGIYPINPGATSWLSNNLAGPAKRAIGIAYAVSLTNVGGIFASYIFLDSEEPAYPTGFGTTIAMVILGLVAVVCLEGGYVAINRRRDGAMESGLAEDIDARAVGDRAVSFRYTL
ncbi:major facilitator superfamily domain-containing protein [Aspergillus undulatus]|uniref:major facilitator superfamily domain-containing protein n=1 Tax=Aspergillus undulatus TaxID=1810928 RepID=UPI003CCCA31C